jgi:DNA-3-methyladenine glycosylase II
MSPSRPAGAHARRRSQSWSDDDRYLMRADKVLAEVIREAGPIDPDSDRRGSRPDPFQALSRAIVGQQLSTRAARTIWERVVAEVGTETPNPKQILATDPEKLREAGLSRSKASFLRDLAERVENGRLELTALRELPDEDVIAALIEVKGIGRWTAEMFLMFHLARPDVISVGDLGIRRAIQIAYGMKELPDPTEMERISEAWRPHRTLACLYLWRSLENAPV